MTREHGPHARAAVTAVLAGKANGIGFALTGTDIGAVDLDHCRDPETGTIAAWAQEILDAAPTAYHEVTVSGTGLRIIGTAKGNAQHKKFAISGGRPDAAIELYRQATRYITMSVVSKSAIALNCRTSTRSSTTSSRVMAGSGNGFDFDKDDQRGERKQEPKPEWTEHEEARVRAALKFIPADDRQIWLHVGMALHWTAWGDKARTIWGEWSKTAPDKFDETDQAKTWRGFRTQRDKAKTLATVFALAIENGWDSAIRAVLPGNGCDEGDGRDLKASLPELEAALGAMPNSATWEEWNRIGMATWVASGGQGFDAFDAWSKKHPKYDERTRSCGGITTTNHRRAASVQAPSFILQPRPTETGAARSKSPKRPTGRKKLPRNSDKALHELARKSRVEYDQARKQAAADLKIRKKTLDDEVEKRREKIKVDEAPPLYRHWAVKPYKGVVEGDYLLRALVDEIRRYVFMTDEQAVAVALWVVFTWLHDREDFVTHSPILFVTSAEKDSGKTTLLKVVSFLVRCGLPNVSISGPALFRSIEKWTPCFIIDEADTALVDNDDLRAVMNTGWTRGDGVIRCDPDSREPMLYSTFAPKAIGMKGRKLPDTTLSRCIIIAMRPRRPNEEAEWTEDFNHLDNHAFARLRNQLTKWATSFRCARAKNRHSNRHTVTSE